MSICTTSKNFARNGMENFQARKSSANDVALNCLNWPPVLNFEEGLAHERYLLRHFAMNETFSQGRWINHQLHPNRHYCFFNKLIKLTQNSSSITFITQHIKFASNINRNTIKHPEVASSAMSAPPCMPTPNAHLADVWQHWDPMVASQLVCTPLVE